MLRIWCYWRETFIQENANINFQLHRRNKMCFQKKGSVCIPFSLVQRMHVMIPVHKNEWFGAPLCFDCKFAKACESYSLLHFRFATGCLYEKLINWKATPPRHKHAEMDVSSTYWHSIPGPHENNWIAQQIVIQFGDEQGNGWASIDGSATDVSIGQISDASTISSCTFDES